MHIVNNRLFR